MGVKLTQEMIDGALLAQKEHGIPASVTLGQIMLESGGSYSGGLSGLAYKYKNLFGIKSNKNNKYQSGSASMNNKAGTDPATYAVFKNFSDSILEHSRILNLSRYRSKITTGDYKDWANALQKGGYATSGSYASKLISIIEKNDLHKYDGQTYSGSSSDVTSTGANHTGFFGNMFAELLENIVVTVFIGMLLIFGVFFLVKAFGGSPSKIAEKSVSKVTKEVMKSGDS